MWYNTPCRGRPCEWEKTSVFFLKSCLFFLFVLDAAEVQPDFKLASGHLLAWVPSLDIPSQNYLSRSGVKYRLNSSAFSLILCCCSGTKSCSALLRLHRLYPMGLLYPWDFPCKNTRVGCCFLLYICHWVFRVLFVFWIHVLCQKYWKYFFQVCGLLIFLMAYFEEY